MKILKGEKVDIKNYHPSVHTSCSVYKILIEIDESDLKKESEDMVTSTLDKSWISKLISPADKQSYLAKAEKTIEEFVTNVINSDNIYDDEIKDINTKFGEYLISHNAQKGLKEIFGHLILPLAEIWKERESGNGGFDFHTISQKQKNNIVFGEAKYSNSTNRHGDALDGLNSFIKRKMDVTEISDIDNFVKDKTPIENFLDANPKKSFAAAFSIKTEELNVIMENSLNSRKIINLLEYDELFIIGIKI